jgi:hypothetical protein
MSTDPKPTEIGAHQDLTPAERDKLSPVWDMSQERMFMENLLGQRFNFSVIFFSVVIAGSLNSKSRILTALVLSLGALISVLFTRVLARTQEKLDLIIADLLTDPSDPVSIIDARATKTASKRKIIGHTIPRVCCTVLIVYSLYSWPCVIVPSARLRDQPPPNQTMERTAGSPGPHLP